MSPFWILLQLSIKDVVATSYKTYKAPVKSSPPTNQHPAFYRPDGLPVTHPTVPKVYPLLFHLKLNHQNSNSNRKGPATQVDLENFAMPADTRSFCGI